MKALIWIGCFLCLAILQMVIKDSGIILGGIPTALLFLLTWFVIKKLCKKYDWSRAMKAVNKSRMSLNEYAKQGLSDEFVEKIIDTPYEEAQETLKAKKKEGVITHEQYIILLKLCSWTPGKDERPQL